MSDTPAKQRAHALIDALPDGASWSDILYALELASDIDQGRQDADVGEVLDPASLPDWHVVEVKRRLAEFADDADPGKPLEEVIADIKRRR